MLHVCSHLTFLIVWNRCCYSLFTIWEMTLDWVSAPEQGFLNQICLISESILSPHNMAPPRKGKVLLYSWSISLRNFETGSCSTLCPLSEGAKTEDRAGSLLTHPPGSVLLYVFRSHMAAQLGLSQRLVSKSQVGWMLIAFCTSLLRVIRSRCSSLKKWSLFAFLFQGQAAKQEE